MTKEIKLEFGNPQHIALSQKLPILNYREPAEHQCDCQHCEADVYVCPNCDEINQTPDQELDYYDNYYSCPECKENFATFWQKGNIVELFNKTFGTDYNSEQIKKVLFKNEENEK